MNIEEKLSKIKGTDAVVGVYTDPLNTDKFSAGFLSDFNSEYILIESLTPLGKYDGYLLRNMSSVYRIDTEGTYETQLGFLAKHNKILHTKVSADSSGGIRDDFFKFAWTNSKIISIELHDSGYSDIIGYIAEYDKKNCYIKRINHTGGFDGYSFIYLDDITKISCDGEEERKLDILYKKDNI